jgi:hypothetical protein
MAKNQIETQYDDAGFPVNAANTISITLTSSLTAQAVKTAPGRLAKVSVTTALVGAGGTLVFWDNASAASGTPLYVLPTATGVLGYVASIDLPALVGIYMTNPSGTITAGAVTVGYS